MVNMGVCEESNKNVAIWRRILIDQTIRVKIIAKMRQRHFFLCIFQKFLCKHKSEKRQAGVKKMTMVKNTKCS